MSSNQSNGNGNTGNPKGGQAGEKRNRARIQARAKYKKNDVRPAVVTTYSCAIKTLHQLKFNDNDIDFMKNLVRDETLIDAFRAAAVLRRNDHGTMKEIEWFLNRTKEFPGMVMLALAYAIVDIESVDTAIGMHKALEDVTEEDEKSIFVQTGAFAVNSDDSLLICAQTACKKVGLTDAEISEILSCAADRKAIAALRTAELMKKSGKPFWQTRLIVKAVDHKQRANVLYALSIIFANPIAFDIALGIYDNELLPVQS